MDFSKLLSLLPYIMQAISLVREIGASKKSGSSIISIVQDKTPEVLDVIANVGKELFPELPAEDQVQVGAVRLDPPLVTKLQTQLNKAGAAPQLDVDGSYGPLTRKAVEAFQQKSGLAVDGWAGPETQKALDSLVPTAEV